jgi:hypothetical protein
MFFDAVGAMASGWAIWLATGRPALAISGGAALAAVFARRATARDAARRLEKRDPDLDGAVTAFAEGGGGRLREPLAEWVLERRPRASYRRSAAVLAAAVAATGGATWARSLPRGATSSSPPVQAQIPAGAPSLRLSVDVAPPVYAQRPAIHVDEPSAPLGVLKGSIATLTVQTSAPEVDATEEGKPERRITVRGGQAKLSLTLEKPTAFRIGRDRVVVFAVVPDRPPEVELTLPREDHTVTKKPAAFAVEAVARDDIGLASLAVFYTLAHGHGEGMQFKSGRVDGPKVVGSSARMSTPIDPEALGLGPGDTLVTWAEATDSNAVDGPGRTASSVRILRWDEELAAVELRSSAPAPRLLSGPLSQREILARTIRLIGEGLGREKLRERALDLAQAQANLRTAFGFFLRAEEGNAVELDVEEKEAGEPGSDRARHLVADAVSEMWSSEGELQTGNPQASVPHQKRAVKLLDEAFGNERYALRALAAPKAPVDEGRRLKGESKDLTPRAAAAPSPEAGPDAARVRSLARRLLLASGALGSAPARALADALWALPEMANLPRAALAAPLYAARRPEEVARAERLAADALLHYLDPNPMARPAVSPEEARFFTRLDGEGRPPPREARRPPAR